MVARKIEPAQVVALSRENHCDIALVGLGESSERALELIGTVTHEAACPVVAVLHAPDPAFVAEAARRGIFAAVAHDDPGELQSAIEITLARFSAFRNLEGAFGRRALIERAKGILMERHGIDERDAFDLLRRHSQHNGRKLADLAKAVTDSYLLLPSHAPPESGDREPAG